MLSSIFNRILLIFQLLLVIFYIIFEEIIWEGVAKPIYEYIHSFKILQNIELKLQSFNNYIILFIFISLLLLVETFGLYAGVLFVSGHMILGLSLYIAKLPIAGFTFWLFRATEEKLMAFGWFAWLYNLIIRFMLWIKSTQIYQDTLVYTAKIKASMKAFKSKYFADKSSFIEKLKKLYHSIKASLKK